MNCDYDDYYLRDVLPPRENPFPNAMLFDELSSLKTNDKVEMRGKLPGIYDFISMTNDKVTLKDDRCDFTHSYYLADIGVVPYKANLWNCSNYLVSNKKKE